MDTLQNMIAMTQLNKMGSLQNTYKVTNTYKSYTPNKKRKKREEKTLLLWHIIMILNNHYC